MNDSSANDSCTPSKKDLVNDLVYPKLTIRQLLATASQRLKLALATDERTARLEARMLLSHLLQVDHAWMIAHANQALDDQIQANKTPVNQTQANQTLASAASRQTHSGISPRLNPSRPGPEANIYAVFEALLKRRLAGEPMAYILEHREFYGMDLQVSPATLIPRADTETLVDAALEKVLPDAAWRILDLGTGSGAIALAIAKHRPNSMVTAVDASPKALQIAQTNAHKLAIHNIDFLLSDWFAGLAETNTTVTNTTEPNTMLRKFDIIVSNPPYIAASDHHLSSGDLRFEPLSALAAGIDGLDDIRKIVGCAPKHLHSHGWLMLEHGYDQAGKVALLLEQAGFRQIQHVQDLAGIARVTIGRLDAMNTSLQPISLSLAPNP